MVISKSPPITPSISLKSNLKSGLESFKKILAILPIKPSSIKRLITTANRTIKPPTTRSVLIALFTASPIKRPKGFFWLFIDPFISLLRER